jgi:hypothetical protein
MRALISNMANHPGVLVFLQEKGHHPGDQENVDQGTGELVQEDFQRLIFSASASRLGPNFSRSAGALCHSASILI